MSINKKAHAAKNKETEQAASHTPLAKVETDSRMVFLTGGIDKDSANKTTRALLLLDELSNNPIKLFVNSPGGEVNSGFAIFDCIRFIHSQVYIIGAGLIASAAALIYAAVPTERRVSLPHSRYLLHQPLSGIRGVVTDLEIYSKEIEGIKRLINEILATATGQDFARMEKDTDRDFWLDTWAAKNYGLVGSVIEHKAELQHLFAAKTRRKQRSSSVKKSTETKNSKNVTTTIGATSTDVSKTSAKKNRQKTGAKTAEKAVKTPTKKPAEK